jgi:hypothetical protein
MELLNENISHEDLKKYIKELYNYASKKLNIDVPPRLFLRRDKANAEDILGKTGGYDPDNQEIHLYVTDRHPKDILRSLAHELVHHSQKLAGFDADLNIGLIHQDPAYASHDEGLREMERDAFERGNMIFRDWTDGKKTERETIMNEMKKSKVVAAHKKAKKMMKHMKDEYGSKEGERIAYATAMKQAKSKKESKEEKDSDHVKMAEEQAKQDAQARYGGKDLEEQSDFESVENSKTASKMYENNNSETQHPYPQLFEEKPRLMQDAFNKKEDLVYQELIRRFIKK